MRIALERIIGILGRRTKYAYVIMSNFPFIHIRKFNLHRNWKGRQIDKGTLMVLAKDGSVYPVLTKKRRGSHRH